jgi:hypothetical protein
MDAWKKAGLAITLFGTACLAVAKSGTVQATPQGAAAARKPAAIRFFPGLVGIASGQRARLSVASILPKPAPGEAARGPISFDLAFFTDRGAVIARLGVEVSPGESRSLDVAFEDALLAAASDPSGLPAPPTNRVEVRAWALGTAAPATEPGAGREAKPGPCRVSLEVYDAVSGRTLVGIFPVDPPSGEPANDPNDVNN